MRSSSQFAPLVVSVQTYTNLSFTPELETDAEGGRTAFPGESFAAQN